VHGISFIRKNLQENNLLLNICTSSVTKKASADAFRDKYIKTTNRQASNIQKSI